MRKLDKMGIAECGMRNTQEVGLIRMRKANHSSIRNPQWTNRAKAIRNDRKGFFFTMDALIAVTIISFAFLSIAIMKPSAPSENTGYERMHYIAEDAMQLFGMAKLADINSTISSDILANTNVTQDYLNKSILETVGSLWADGKTGYVGNISRDFFPGIIPAGYNYAISIKDITGKKEVLYSSTGSAPEAGNVAALTKASRIVSGYRENATAFGYTARAWATKVTKNNTLIVMGDVISSSLVKSSGHGTNQNNVNITYIIDVPANATIMDATWFVESAWTGNKFNAYINGHSLGGNAGCSGGTATYYYPDLQGWIFPGRNIGNVVWQYSGPCGDSNREGGDDGATHFLVTYNTSTINTLFAGNRFYFEETVADYASIEYKKPLFFRSNITSMMVHMNYTNYTGGTLVQNSTLSFMYNGNVTNISTKSVNKTSGGVSWSDTEIRSAISSAGLSYLNLSGRYFWFIVDLDQYHDLEDKSYQHRIFGNDSYVEINSTSSGGLIYNYIDITKPIANVTYSDGYSGDFYRKLNWYFNITSTSAPLEARWQFAWLYGGGDPSQIAKANGITLYNHTSGVASGDPLIKEFVRFGYNDNPDAVLTPSSSVLNNLILIFSGNYGVNPYNSLGEYTVLVPSSVGYGNVFNTSTLAKNDAVSRLMNILGAYVSANEIQADVPLVTGSIPWMYGPAIVTLEVWKQ